MAKNKAPMTQAIRELKSHKAEFELHPYKYEDKGGAAGAAHALGLDEYQVVKTLVMEDENKQALLVLMHGDKEVSTKALARAIGVKAVQPCDPKKANALTGYMVGASRPLEQKEASGLRGSLYYGLEADLHQCGKTRLAGLHFPQGSG